MKIAIIVPVFNEEATISNFLDYLFEIQNPEFTQEIIVVDGGSQDKTLKILEKYTNVKIVHSKKGRAIQMNCGAKNAISEILYFLHCDTFPPKNFDYEIVNHLKNGNLSGCFKMKFDNSHIVLKVSQWFTQFNSKSCRGGDQSLFVSRNLFEEIQGFDENLIIYEDNELIHRLYEKSKFTVIQKVVVTSARKYLKNGVWKLQFHFLVIHWMYCFGFGQQNLKKYYYWNIK